MRALRRAVARALGLPVLVVAPVATYLGVVTAAASVAVRRGRTAEPSRRAPVTRFVVLIPAHDEEPVIGAALAGLRALDYPADLFEVHVVADNCTDATADIVRAHGFTVHERTAPDDGGKGPALSWLLQRLWDADVPHDAVVIIDADTTVSTNLLRVGDAALRDGARVVQAYYGVRDSDASTATAFRAAALAVRHYLRPLGRAQLGGTVGLFGNGMMFAADVLRRRSFSRHLVEDIEFSLDLLLDGTKVVFAPAATVEAEMPTTTEASQTQHERWERGRLEMARQFVPRLARAAVAGGPAGRLAYADAAIDQLVPPFSLVAASTVGAVGSAALGALVSPGRATRRRLLVALAAAAVHTGYVLYGLRLVRAPRQVYRSLLAAPRLVLWKIGLWLRMVGRGDDVAWVRTARNATTAAEQPVDARR